MSDLCWIEACSPVERFEPRKASAGSAFDVIHAGTIPKITPVSNERTKANPSTGSDRQMLRTRKRQRQDHTSSGIRHNQARNTSHACKQNTLCQQLSDQPLPSSTKRHADRGLGLTR